MEPTGIEPVSPRGHGRLWVVGGSVWVDRAPASSLRWLWVGSGLLRLPQGFHEAAPGVAHPIGLAGEGYARSLSPQRGASPPTLGALPTQSRRSLRRVAA